MARRYQPLTPLVCLALLTLGLVSARTLEPTNDPAGNGGVSLGGPPLSSDEGPADSTRLYRICRVTAYCDRGTTACGVQSGVGQCAAPGYVPFGSQVYIAALGRTFVVTDRTHRRFRHNTVDIFLPSREQCLTFGRRYLKCEFTIPAPGG